MKYIVNYLWLRKHVNATDPIPSASFCLFQRNAKKYADAEFHLWVEDDKIFRNYAISSNVRIKYLNDNSMADGGWFFAKRLPENFEATLDILRLLILQKTLTDNPDAIAVYSDFDVPDLFLCSDDLRLRMEKYGAAFAGSYIPTSTKLIIKGPFLWQKRETKIYSKILKSNFENGFMAFDYSALPLLEAMIESSLKDLEAVVESQDRRDIIYGAGLDRVFTFPAFES